MNDICDDGSAGDGEKDEPCKAETYQHGHFKEWKAEFKAGAYDVKDMKKKEAKNDDASPIKVFGTECEAIVHDMQVQGMEGHFQNWCVPLQRCQSQRCQER